MTVVAFWAGTSSEVAVTTKLRGSTWTGRGGRGFGRITGDWWEVNYKTFSGELPTLALDYENNQYAVDTGSGLVETTFGTIHTYTGASLATQRDYSGKVIFKPHNLMLRSQEFNVSPWTKFALTGITANATTAPDGTPTADKIIPDGTNTKDHLVYDLNFVTTTSAVSMRFGVFAKAAGYGGLQLMAVFNASNRAVTFDLDAGTIIGVGSLVTDSGIVSFDNGWYYCFVETVTIATTPDIRYHPSPTAGLNTDASIDAYSGDTTSGIFLWGAQGNLAPMAAANDTFAETYVPTTTTAVYQHRITHDKDGNPIGLAIEEARTSIALQSNAFATSPWQIPPSQCSATLQTATGPDGLTSAWPHVVTNAGGSSAAYATQTFTVDTSTVYTYSVFAKKGVYNWLSIRSVAFVTPANSIAGFDLNNGVVGTKDAGFSASTMEDFGNGWFRCSVTFTTDSSDTSGSIRLYITNTDQGLTADRNGLNSIILFGAQFEKGARPSSYIPTTTVAVTRLDELCTVPIANWDHNAVANSLVMDFTAEATGTTILGSEGGLANRVNLTQARIRQRVTANTYTRDLTISVGRHTIAGGADASGQQHSLDGATTVAEDATTATQGTVTSIIIGGSGNGARINGIVASFASYNTRLIANDLEGLAS